MAVSNHIPETDLALYVSNDLPVLRRIAVRLHERSCQECHRAVESYRSDLRRVKETAAEMPEGVDWERLSAEMIANVHLGLAAGEAVAQVGRHRRRKSDHQILSTSWRMAAAAAGVVMLLSAAWLLNMPSGTTQELGRALSAVMHGKGSVMGPDRVVVVEATPRGVELRQNGLSFGGSHEASPAVISVSMQGSASAQYVTADQVTITSVYAQ